MIYKNLQIKIFYFFSKILIRKFFGEDAMYLYNVGLIKNHSDKEKKWCPKTTASQSEYCLKDCYMIHKEIAQVYIKTNGKWKKSVN